MAIPGYFAEITPTLILNGLDSLSNNFGVSSKLTQDPVADRFGQDNYGLMGQTYNINDPVTLTAEDEGGSAYGPSAAITPTGKTITTDKWRRVVATFNAADWAFADRGQGFVGQTVQQMLYTALQDIDTDVNTVYKGVTDYVGDPAAACFADGTARLSLLRKGNAKLDVKKAPGFDRRLVLGSYSFARAVGDNSVFSALNRGVMGDPALAVGGLPMDSGEVLLANTKTYSNQANPTHTAGTGTAYQLNGAALIGATSITVDTGSGTVVVGDILSFTLSGTTYTVAVTAALAANVIGITASPIAIPDNTAVTVLGAGTTYEVNLMGRTPAIGLTSRWIGARPGIAASAALMGSTSAGGNGDYAGGIVAHKEDFEFSSWVNAARAARGQGPISFSNNIRASLLVLDQYQQTTLVLTYLYGKALRDNRQLIRVVGSVSEAVA